MTTLVPGPLAALGFPLSPTHHEKTTDFTIASLAYCGAWPELVDASSGLGHTNEHEHSRNAAYNDNCQRGNGE